MDRREALLKGIAKRKPNDRVIVQVEDGTLVVTTVGQLRAVLQPNESRVPESVKKKQAEKAAKKKTKKKK